MPRDDLVRRRKPSARRLDPATGMWERAIAAGLSGVLLAGLALEGGGFDTVDRGHAWIVVWWGLALALAFGVLPRARPNPRLRAAAWILLALIAWTALSLVWTESDERSFIELTRVVGYLGLVALGLTALTPNAARGAAAGIVYASATVVVLAVLSRLLPGLLESDDLVALERQRLVFPLGYWNAVAAWSGITLGILLALSSHLRSEFLRGASLAVAPVCVVAIYLTYSRGGIIAAVIAGLAVLALSPHRATVLIHSVAVLAGSAVVILVIRGEPSIADGTGGAGGGLVLLVLAAACAICAGAATMTLRARTDRRRPARWPVPAALLATAATIVIGIATQDRVATDLAAGRHEAAAPAADPADRLTNLSGIRDTLWGSALEAAKSEPFTGIGPGAFEFWWARDESNEADLVDAHSLYLEMLAELGIPGVLLAVAALGLLGAGAWQAASLMRRSARRGLAIGLLAGFTAYLVAAGVDWMWESTAVSVLGLGSAVVAAAFGAAPRSRPPRLGWRRPLAVFLAVAAGATQIPPLVSTERIRAATASAVAGDIEAALESADEAADAQPWAASPLALRAFLHLTAGDAAAARTDALEAVEREPTNWRHRLLLVRAEIAEGNEDAASKSLTELGGLRAAMAPRIDEIRAELGLPAP